MVELKQQLLPIVGPRNNFSQHLVDLYQLVAPLDQADSDGYLESEGSFCSTEFSEQAYSQTAEFDEEGPCPTEEVNGEYECFTEFGRETPSYLAESSGEDSYMNLVNEIDHMIVQGGEDQEEGCSRYGKIRKVIYIMTTYNIILII